MATIRKVVHTSARPDAVWDAVRDLGALHTRLVPGFVTATQLAPGERVVTFANGMVIREPIVSVDETLQRVAWTAVSEGLTHYNSSAEVLARPDGTTTVVWTSDVLPDTAAPLIDQLMTAGQEAMQAALDRLANRERTAR
jgi:hypothetical protein